MAMFDSRELPVEIKYSFLTHFCRRGWDTSQLLLEYAPGAQHARLELVMDFFFDIQVYHTVDGSEIPNNHTSLAGCF